ncbi:MAG: sigma factor-like helix-turn-helix DNA-binding protein [Acidimicrobiia bacterium]
MSRRSAPLFGDDDGWPYPDGTDDRADTEEVDLDVLELRADPHAFDALTDEETRVVRERFGLDGTEPRSMKELAHAMDRTHAEIRELLGNGLEKLRDRITTP